MKADEPTKTKKEEAAKKSQPSLADLPPADKSADKQQLAEVPADSEEKKSENRPTSRFRRSSKMSKKMRGTLVAEFPKRLVVKYDASIGQHSIHVGEHQFDLSTSFFQLHLRFTSVRRSGIEPFAAANWLRCLKTMRRSNIRCPERRRR